MAGPRFYRRSRSSGRRKFCAKHIPRFQRADVATKLAEDLRTRQARYVRQTGERRISAMVPVANSRAKLSRHRRHFLAIRSPAAAATQRRRRRARAIGQWSRRPPCCCGSRGDQHGCAVTPTAPGLRAAGLTGLTAERQLAGLRPRWHDHRQTVSSPVPAPAPAFVAARQRHRWCRSGATGGVGSGKKSLEQDLAELEASLKEGNVVGSVAGIGDGLHRLLDCDADQPRYPSARRCVRKCSTSALMLAARASLTRRRRSDGQWHDASTKLDLRTPTKKMGDRECPRNPA